MLLDAWGSGWDFKVNQLQPTMTRVPVSRALLWKFPNYGK
jgi:hypothetical protein